MCILGVKIIGHDTGAAIIAGDNVFAIAEERVNRIKHSRNMFPRLSIDYCLKAADCKDSDIVLVVIDQVDEPGRYSMKEIFNKETGGRFAHAKIEVINHHDAHAASAFFCSPFNEAAVMVVDGAGEKFPSFLGVPLTETETMYIGKDNTLTEFNKTLHLRLAKNFPYTFGIGKLYTTITRYLNFGDYEEGKTMGLAPYGNSILFEKFPVSRWWKEWHGHFICNALIRYPKTITGSTASLLTRLMFFLKQKIHNAFLSLARTFGASEYFQIPKIFDPIHLPEPIRPKETKLPDEYYTNIAFMIQNILEDVVCSMASRIRAVSKQKYLCIAGGVGLNSVVNKKIIEECGFEDIWIQPACSDTGVALGCALYGYCGILKRPRRWTMQNAYLGRPYSQKETVEAINRFGDQISVVTSQNIASDTADALVAGKIVGWFQGEAEYGPRALGHRSILVDPRPTHMKDTLNNRVKHREPWRPFAASVLADRVGEYFDLDRPSPYMLLVCNVKPELREKIPAVVHVDGTCRIQTVTKEENGLYYDLIQQFANRTGVPLILNTSYNLAGEPIVETPDDAIKDMLNTNIDMLVIGDLILTKRTSHV